MSATNRFSAFIRRLTPLWATLGILVYPFFEARWLQIDQRTIASPSLPPLFDGLRIAFLSDIHAGWSFGRARVQKLVAQVNALHPDIIILGGDYAHDSDGAVAFFRDAPRFLAPMGVYAVPGNHDRVMPEANLPLLLDAMREAGITPLCNTVLPLVRDRQRILLAGVDDYKVGHPDIAGIASQVRAKDYVIFALHNPDGLPESLAATDADGSPGWIDLALCGHTHGGQVTLWGLRGIVHTNGQTRERYRTGQKREAGADILITNGVGTSFLPIRFFARPQVNLITLQSKSADE